MTELEKLKKENEELRTALEKQKKTCEILKKRVIRIAPQYVRQPAEVANGQVKYDDISVDSTSRVKSVFLENVSHEIRSSMNGVIGMTDLMLETDLSQEQRMYLEMVSSSVDRLLVVVNEVLDFSKIETGELELEPEDFNIKESLDYDL